MAQQFRNILISAICAGFLWAPTQAHGETLCDSLPERCDSFVYMLRLKARKTSTLPVTIIFGQKDTLHVEVPSLADAADGVKAQSSWELNAAENRPEKTRKGKFETSIDAVDGGWTICLRGNVKGVRLGAGGPCEEAHTALPRIITENLGTIRVILPDGTGVLNRSLRYDSLVQRKQIYPSESIDGLTARLQSSRDPIEGVYTYLDRNIDPKGAAGLSRTDYILAIEAHPDITDGYRIIYLGGGAPGWPAGQEKGILRPTLFIGHFDLEWTDHRGHLLKEECSAQMSPDNNIVTLNFPHQKARLRFSRALREGVN